MKIITSWSGYIPIKHQLSSVTDSYPPNGPRSHLGASVCTQGVWLRGGRGGPALLILRTVNHQNNSSSHAHWPPLTRAPWRSPPAGSCGRAGRSPPPSSCTAAPRGPPGCPGAGAHRARVRAGKLRPGAAGRQFPGYRNTLGPCGRH